MIDPADLARRAVAAPEWRWMPGMRAVPPPEGGMMMLPIRLGDDKHPSYPEEYDWPHDLGLRIPDLRDAATVGAVVERIRDYCGLPTAFLLPPHIPGAEGTAGLWSLLPHAGVSPILALEPLGSGPTQAHALVDAFRRGLPRPGGEK